MGECGKLCRDVRMHLKGVASLLTVILLASTHVQVRGVLSCLRLELGESLCAFCARSRRSTALHRPMALAVARSDAVALLFPDGTGICLQAFEHIYQPGRKLLQCTTQAACIARCPAGNSPIYLAPQVSRLLFSSVPRPVLLFHLHCMVACTPSVGP